MHHCFRNSYELIPGDDSDPITTSSKAINDDATTTREDPDRSVGEEPSRILPDVLLEVT